MTDDIVVEEDHVVPMGGMDHVDLSFEGLKLVLENGGKTREILDGSIRGRAKPGRMLAILGPSGAGKSTVIHALAGRVKDNPRLKLYGNRYINGHPLSGDSMVPAAFVEQDVSFFPHMTVRETLNFRVELKLGPKLSKKARDKMVTDLMSQLGLTKSADTPVGDAKVRGISGGERKRLSIAVEMIAQPNMIFLDEPTSGLDSTAATNLVTTLRNLADQGKTVVAVIHQPSQHVFAKFDDLILVSEGKLMYSGERTGVRSYLEKHGCPAPPEMGSAEHVLDCISLLPIEDETEEEAHGRVHRLAAEAAKKHIDLGPISGEGDHGVTRFVSKSGHGPRANLLVQFRLLFTRAIREVARGKAALILKIVQQVTTAFIYGGIYSLGTNQASIQDRIGLLSLIAIGTTNIAIGQTIRSFPREKTIVSNEIASKMYRTLPYFIGKAISELPVVAFLNGLFGVLVYRLTGLNRAVGRFRNFLGLLIMHGFVSESTGLVMGAIAPNTDVALAMFPAVIVLNIIFDVCLRKKVREILSLLPHKH
jgi:ABC-type multidrug transport system ATPase subunit